MNGFVHLQVTNSWHCSECGKNKLFFAHPENINMGMIGDSNSSTRQLAVNKILKLSGYNFQKDSTLSTENKVRKFVVI